MMEKQYMMEGGRKKGGKEEDDGGRDNTALCAKHDYALAHLIPPPLMVETQISMV